MNSRKGVRQKELLVTISGCLNYFTKQINYIPIIKEKCYSEGQQSTEYCQQNCQKRELNLPDKSSVYKSFKNIILSY